MQLSPPKSPTSTPAGGSSAAKGLEFAGVVVVFMLSGWMLDGVAGTTPWLLIVFVVLGFVGQFARAWYAFDAAVREHQSQSERIR